ncbi:MAG TPA: 6-bladed beta-propeller [Gemmatimonadales bacterium]|nr:6-bladed beta-propeller [Gemmatimonadales bacterium]
MPALALSIALLRGLAGCGGDAPRPPAARPAREALRENAPDAFEQLFQLEHRVRLAEAAEDPIGEVMDLEVWDGKLVVVDGIQANLKVFDRDGRLVQTIGRPGDGPGEFRQPWRAAVVAGDRLAVLDLAHSHLSLFAPGGVYERRWSLPGFVASSLMPLDGGEQLVIALQIVADGRSLSPYALHVFDLAGRRLESFRETPQPTRPGEANAMMLVAARVGSVVVSAPYATNRILHHDLRTGREWTVVAGESIYREPEWSRWRVGERVSPSVYQEWFRRQMWLTKLVALDSSRYAAGFTIWGSGPGASYQYAVLTADGTELVTTKPTPRALFRVYGGTAYATVTLDDGSTLLETYRVRLPSP